MSNDNALIVAPDIQAVATQARALTITTPETLTEASGLMVSLRKLRKREEVALKDRIAPLTDQIKAMKDRANLGITLLVNAETVLESAILAYNWRAREAAAKLQAEAQAKYDRKLAKAEAKAEETGKPMPLIAPPPIIQAPPTHLTTPAGSLTARTTKEWRIPGVAAENLAGLYRDDPRVKDIPDRFFVLRTSDIGKLVRAIGQAGQPLPGCPGVEVYEVEGLAVR